MIDDVGYSRPRCPHRSAANPRAGSGSQSRAQSSTAGGTPAKRTVGDTVAVSADIFRDGHEKLRAVVRYKAPGARTLAGGRAAPVDAHINGVRWAGEFTVETPGRWEFTIEAWTDLFAHLARRAAAQGRGRPGTRTSRARSPRASCCSSAPSRARRRRGLDRAR